MKAIIEIPKDCIKCISFQDSGRNEEQCLLFGYDFSYDKEIAPCPACIKAKEKYRKLKSLCIDFKIDLKPLPKEILALRGMNYENHNR